MLIRKADAAEAHHAVAIWREVASWLQAAGRELWDPASFSVAQAQTLAAAGELVLGIDAGRPVACMTLQLEDRLFWPGAEDDAFYLHKLAVSRAEAGLGWSTAMIEWAYREAVRHGVSALRLDCAPRPELVRLYEGHGFERIDAVPVRLGGFEVVRFERSVR